MGKKSWILGSLLFLVTAASVFYITLGTQAQIKVEATKTTFFINESGNFVISGAESFCIRNSTKSSCLKTTSKPKIEYSAVDNFSVIKRTSSLQYGVVVVDEYAFDPENGGIELFPVSHKTIVSGAIGKQYVYKVSSLSGPVGSFEGNSIRFGRNMEIEFQPTFLVAKSVSLVAPYSASFTYIIPTDYESYSMRLFDPPITNGTVSLALNGNNQTVYAELGTNISVNATISSGTVCVDIDHFEYGVNYSCGTGSALLNFTPRSFQRFGLNNTSAYNLTYNVSGFQTVYVNASTYDEVVNLSLYLYGYNTSTATFLQESANVATAEGGLSTGTYNVVDYYLYVNYSKPTLAISATWHTKHSNILTDEPLPSTCFAQNPVQVRIYSKINYTVGATSSNSTSYCYNGSIWYPLRSYNNTSIELGFSANSANTYDGDYSTSSYYDETRDEWREGLSNPHTTGTVQEEGMYWQVTTLNTLYPTGVYLSIGNNTTNYIGNLFNDTNFNITTFDDSFSSKSIIFNNSQSIAIGYFRLPKSANISFANLKVSGGFTYALQDTADVINYTQLGSAGFNGSIYLNYTKQIGANNNTVWEVKIGNSSSSTISNNTIPASCWSQSSSSILFQLTSSTNGSWFKTSLAQCFNGTTWLNIKSDSSTSVGFYCTAVAWTAPVHTLDSYYSTASTWHGGSSSSGYWCASTSNFASSDLYGDAVYWFSQPYNVTVRVGTINGTNDFTHNGFFNTSNTTINLSASINSFLNSCTADASGYCQVPVYVYSQSAGMVNVSNITITYTYNVNPVVINASFVQSYLNSATPAVSSFIPIRIYSGQGIIGISNVTYTYRGGAKNYTVSAHNATNGSVASIQVNLVYSGWNYTLPNKISYIEFIPTKGPTQKNLSAYGQSSTRPILNITSNNYGNQYSNFSIYLNTSNLTCVNISAALTNNLTNTIRLSDTWTTVKQNASLGTNFGVYLFANLSCTISSWQLQQPQFYFRMCAAGSNCSEALT